jgi:hypothetical protein
MHHESEWGPRPERERGDEVHILGKKIEPFCPFLDGLYISQHVALVRLVEPTLAKYLHFWTISPANGRSQLLADTYGNGKPGLNLDNIRTMVVALPPVSEQVALLVKVEAMLLKADLLGHDVKVIENDLDQLDQSILAKAFRGQLVPQDSNDEPASALLARIREQRAQQAEAAKGTEKTTNMQRRDAMRKNSQDCRLSISHWWKCSQPRANRCLPNSY